MNTLRQAFLGAGVSIRRTNLVFLIATTLSLVSGARAMAGPREDALSIVEKWDQAFSKSDVDGLVALYSPDALFMGTTSKSVATTSQEIRQYFERAVLTNRPRGATLGERSVLVVSDSVVVVTGQDALSQTRDGNQTVASGRVTFVIAKRDAAWQIVHFHRSAMPN